MLHQAVQVVTPDLNGLMDPYLHTVQSSLPKGEVWLSHTVTVQLALCTIRIEPVTALEMIMIYIHVSLSGIQLENLAS